MTVVTCVPADGSPSYYASANEDSAAALTSVTDTQQANSDNAMNFGIIGGAVVCIAAVVAVVVIKKRRNMKRPEAALVQGDKTQIWVGTEAPQITVK